MHSEFAARQAVTFTARCAGVCGCHRCCLHHRRYQAQTCRPLLQPQHHLQADPAALAQRLRSLLQLGMLLPAPAWPDLLPPVRQLPPLLPLLRPLLLPPLLCLQPALRPAACWPPVWLHLLHPRLREHESQHVQPPLAQRMPAPPLPAPRLHARGLLLAMQPPLPPAVPLQPPLLLPPLPLLPLVLPLWWH